MGTYVARTDLVPPLVEERIAVQLTNDEVDGDEVDWSVVDEAILDAEAEVDGHLGAYYSLPLTSTPRLVQQLAARIARYRLYARRPGAVEEWLQTDYDSAVRVLERLATGKVTLGQQPTAAPNPDKAVRSESRARVFGRDNLDGF